MVQTDTGSNKLKRQMLGDKTTRTTKVKYTDGRKAKPMQAKVPEHQKKISSAIGRNIESLMAARVSHEGGHLRVVKAPENVTEYVKSGPKMSKLQVKLRSAQVSYRINKATKHQDLIKAQIDKDLLQQERENAQAAEKRRLRDEEEERMLERKPTLAEIVPMGDDDVAGDFFDEQIGAGFNPVIEAPKDVGINARKKKKVVKVEKKSALLPGRKSGFKGVSNKKAGDLLDEAF